ncbi:RNA polymerase sigma-70 factor [Chondrinema litorale]|uniref:RNA polymerase sigma-70 factor n=1 Tax=Chondrinema litorale TaxID=2994555 RepID=UPI002542F6D0|nr:RNA polymerase sigma-70 factor [Chondrinema litorale]UZR98507.1 RNA polymerase sigma-70 factor [Chondrinema litorale]
MFSNFKKTNNQIDDFKTRKGFENLYKRYAASMLSIAHNKVNDLVVAEEIVQNIFKSLWERRETINLQGNIKNYLFRAVKLEVIDHFRAKERQKSHLKTVTLNYTFISNSTENQVIFDDLKDHTFGLINQLPKQCRNVFKLSREKGYSNKEIAQELLISERAVEYHITKALSFLKRNLVNYIKLK